MNKIVHVLGAIIALCILAFIFRNVFGVEVREGFLFADPKDCSTVCRRNMYKSYCNSQYLDYGPAGLCKCSWDANKRQCMGSKNPNVKCNM